MNPRVLRSPSSPSHRPGVPVSPSTDTGHAPGGLVRRHKDARRRCPTCSGRYARRTARNVLACDPRRLFSVAFSTNLRRVIRYRPKNAPRLQSIAHGGYCHHPKLTRVNGSSSAGQLTLEAMNHGTRSRRESAPRSGPTSGSPADFRNGTIAASHSRRTSIHLQTP